MEDESVDLPAVRECDGYPGLAATWLIQVDESTIRLGVALGLMRRADDGVHEFTPEGSAYFSEWLERKIAEADDESKEAPRG